MHPELTRALDHPRGPARTAAVVAWVQSLFGAPERRPVLVRGAAVELFTGGAYTTGDIDLVGTVPADVAEALRRAGFMKLGRHWLHEAAQVFLEFPSAALDPGEGVVDLAVAGSTVRAISPEGLILDRLSAWVHWGSDGDGANAYLLWSSQRDAIDLGHLRRRARTDGLAGALASLERFARRFGERLATAREVEAWARRRRRG